MKLLVVEDDPDIAELLRRGLVQAGYNVHVERDGPSGVSSATEHDYDAIVLDGILPGLSGLEVCRRLRAAHRRTPVLMLTAQHGVEERARSLDAGADDYMTKPFSFAELSARLHAIIGRGPIGRPAGPHPGNSAST